MTPDADFQPGARRERAAMRIGKLTRLAVATVASTIVLAASLPAAAQEAVFVRNHRGLQVLIQPIGRITDTVVFREIYKDKGEKGSVNDIYAFDCKARTLRYVNLDDNRVIKEGEFYDGVYKKAHDKFCSSYKDPRG
jgi:hypothetical protein